MAKYKDEEILERMGGCLYNSIPVASFVLPLNILERFIYWPLALSLSVMACGLISYWVPERAKHSLLRWVVTTALIAAACFGLAHLAVKLGWVAGWRA
jgi:uncharacterized BrkB/YihY/UPF0761 family membrane protein